MVEAMNFEKEYHETHISVLDDSPAMIVADFETFIVLVNEDGYAWSAEPDAWEEIEQYPMRLRGGDGSPAYYA